MNTLKRCKPLLGTYVEISVSADMSDLSLLHLTNLAFGEIEKIHHAMSFHNSTSELSYINKTSHIKPVLLSADMNAVLQQSLELSVISDGLFDVCIAPHLIAQGLLPSGSDDVNLINENEKNQGSFRDIVLTDNTVFFKKPLMIDLGGIAKGYAVDCAARAIGDCAKFVINAGGDLYCNHWQGEHVEIRLSENIHDTMTLLMSNNAVASSANYFTEKGKSALISPLSKQPIFIEGGVSVFAETTMIADALTKVVSLSRQPKPILAFFNASAVRYNKKGYVTCL